MSMDPSKIEYAPVLYPSTKEFSNFKEYVERLEAKYSNKHGLVKIVAPKSWVPRKKDYDKSISKDIIPAPIEQNAYGKGGIYEMLHIVQKAMSLKEYKKKAQQQDHFTEGKSVEEVEQLFYKNIAFSPPTYGSDSRNTLFDKGCKWNLGEIDCLLNDGLHTLIQGVNEPFVYTGAWKTMFSWHKEDMDLGAINYHHDGKPKFWYTIAQSDSHYLEKTAQSYFADNFNKCSEYLRHKTTVINPYILKKLYPEMKITKMVQYPREFIIVFGGAYHHGFNFGYNIAEAVNYGTINWLQKFIASKPCKCIPQQVRINHQEFYENLILKNPELKSEPKVKAFLNQMKEKGLYTKREIPKTFQLAGENIKKQKEKLDKQFKGSKKRITQQMMELEEQDSFNKIIVKNDNSQNQEQQLQQTVIVEKKNKLLQQKEKPLPIIKKKIEKKIKTPVKNAGNSKSMQQQQQQQKQQLIIQEQQQQQQSRAFKSIENLIQKQQNYQAKRSKNAMVTRGVSDIVTTRRNEKQKKLAILNRKLSSNMRIDNWIQCDNCCKWRKIVERKLELQISKKRSFYCKDMGVKCTDFQDDKGLEEEL